MNEIWVNSIDDLPYPSFSSSCLLDSENSIVLQGGLIHIIKLPKIGVYAYDFSIYSDSIIRTNYEKDSILNYLESVSLCTDTPENCISYIDRIESDELNFLWGFPLLIGALYNSDVYIVIKFRKSVMIRYYLKYTVGFVDDEKSERDFNRTINVSCDSNTLIYRDGYVSYA
jgi:hypothetical protein